MKHKGLNDNKVTADCGLSHGLIGQARHGKSDLGKKTILKILAKYQDLNKIWLLTGEGEMLQASKGSTQEIQDEEKATNRFVKLIDYIKYAKGIKQADIAEQLGVKPSYLSDIRNGRAAFSPTLKNRIYELYSDCLKHRETPTIHISKVMDGFTDNLVETNKQAQTKGDSLKSVIAEDDGFSSRLISLMNEKQIAPYGLLEEKEKKIAELNREIGRLEAMLEFQKKGDAQTGGNATVADAG